MVSPDFTRARIEATRTLRQNGVLRPPVVPRRLAESCGLTVRYVHLKKELKEVCGFIEFDENAISVNADQSVNRQTFTIAHELGHYVLHKNLYLEHPDRYKVLLRKPLGKEIDPWETEANFFAANLLVPKDMLIMYSKYADTAQLAEFFGVSEDVISYRNRSF